MSKYRAGMMGLLAVAGVSAASGGSIPIPNKSFESPATGFVSINVDSWQKFPKPDWYQETGGFLWSQLVGIFKNSATNTADHIDNCDGNQALWLFAVPEVGLFQDYDSFDWHNQPPNHEFNATYEVGRSYHLTVGVIATGGGMVEGATLDLRLYYRDPASNHVVVAARTLTNTPSVFSNNTHFIDCTLHVPPVKAGDPWAGQHIGIEFKSTVATNLQGGYWDLDHVRLVDGPALLNPVYRDGQFAFTLLGEPGAAFEILTTTNETLSAESWVSAGIVTNNSGTLRVTNTVDAATQKLYRARQLF